MHAAATDVAGSDTGREGFTVSGTQAPSAVRANGYRWMPVTEELRAGEQPLRQWFAARLPNVTSVYAEFRRTVPAGCLEPPAGVAPETLGSAFEYCWRLSMDPCASMDVVIDGAVWAGASTSNSAWADLASRLVADLHEQAALASSGPGFSLRRLVRGCWAAALLTEISRGVPFQRSALATLAEDPTPAGLLELMPTQAEQDIQALLERSRRILLPFIMSRSVADVVHGPTFDGPIPGDADLIAGRTLIEIKAVIGRRRRDRTPRWGIDARTLYQIVAYALLAQTEYRVDELALFNPRYAHLHVWPLDALLSQMAGRPVRAEGLGAELRRFLDDPCSADAPAGARRAALAISGRREDSAGKVCPATARGVAAERSRDWHDRRWWYPGPRWPLYSALLDSASTAQARSELAELIGLATSCQPTTVRSWKLRGVPEDQVRAVRRAAAVWTMGGVEAAATAFGLTPRRTASWLAGRGRQSGEELDRIDTAISAAADVVSLRVRLSGTTTTSTEKAPRRAPRQPAGWTLRLNTVTVQSLHDLVTSTVNDIDAALEMLSAPLGEQHNVAISSIRLADILMPDESNAEYALTPDGVSGPGYP